MTDRVHPSSKPPSSSVPPPPQLAPQSKPQQQVYNPSRHPYRPTPAYHNRSRRCTGRRCCLLSCCYTLLLLIFLLLLLCIAATGIYFLYNPRRPSFSISSLRISHFNLTTAPSDESTTLSTSLNLTLSSKNPNKKLIFFYDPISIRMFSASSSQVLLANGSFPEFTSRENNVTIIHTTLSMSKQVLDADSATALRSDLKRKAGLPIKLVVETRVKVKMDKIKVRKFDIVVTCEGIHGQLPKGKIATSATTTKAKCKVDPKFKIWKVTF